MLVRLFCCFNSYIFLALYSSDNSLGSSTFGTGAATTFSYPELILSVGASFDFSYSLTILFLSSLATPPSNASPSKSSKLICLAPIFFLFFFVLGLGSFY